LRADRHRVADLHGEIADWRTRYSCDLSSLRRARTAARVAAQLNAAAGRGGARHRGTGVVGASRATGRVGSKVIALRAEDACRSRRANDLPYKSTVAGKMHACGHDGHTRCDLAPRKYLAETRNFAGAAVGIFSPRRRAGRAGAAMVRTPDGAFRHRGSLRHATISTGFALGALSPAAGRSWPQPTTSRWRSKVEGGHAARPTLRVRSRSGGVSPDRPRAAGRSCRAMSIRSRRGGGDLHVPAGNADK